MTETEIWKPVSGYEGLYDISTCGRIASFHGIGAENSEQKYRILNTTPTPQGYLSIRLSKDKKAITNSVHRLVAIAFAPNPHKKREVNHIDGDKANNNIENLEWVTSSENNLHACRTGLRKAAVGEKSGNSKLTERQVLLIREKYIPFKHTRHDLGCEFGCSLATIRDIISRKTWKHI